MDYIILNDKKPIHKFKNGEGCKTWEEVKNENDVAILVPKGYIVLDFDTTDDAQKMLNIVDGLKLKTKVMKTTRGIHCWFKTDEENPKNAIKNRLAIGLYCDKKAGNRNAYVKIKSNGTMRETIRPCSLDEMQVVPKWLMSISAPSDKFKFKDMGEGSGRNQELFNYIVYLQSKGLDKDTIIETIKIINNYVFEEPLNDSEIESICREDAFLPQEEIDEQISQKTGFSHNEFGDLLIQEFNIIELNNTLYIYEDGYYQADDKIIENKMIKLYPNILQRQRSETLAYIKIKTHVNSKNINIDPYIINLKNTRLDVRDGTCHPFSPNALDFTKLPVIYDPSSYNADLDKMLNRVFCRDKEVRDLFEEMLGTILMKHTKYQSAFLFYGTGSNGKSTIMKLLRNFLGAGNYSTISLEKVADRFNTAELENKIANIGDDANNELLRDTGTLKKIISGDELLVEKKGERPYSIEPYATHIYSCNTIPHSNDKTDGFYRRWIIIPFNAKFSITDEDYDPDIEDKILCESSYSYLLNLALKGVKRLRLNGRYTMPQSVMDIIDDYKTDNSTTLTWIKDNDIDEEYLTTKPKENLYFEFVDWCKNSGIKNSFIPTRRTFHKEIVSKYNFETKIKRAQDDSVTKRFFTISL